MAIDFKETENRWLKFWEEKPELCGAIDGAKNNKKYILVEFPYPSGSGLHVGHAFSFTGGDCHARFKRMQGWNVLFPMGWDAFGLPTENYAIKMKKKPQDVTKENTDMFRNQMKRLGFSFDWTREINTTDPSYYKWTQWIFIKLFEKGLAYKKEMPINWCPSCKIGLANEEVVDGKCERCGNDQVSRRNISQWVVKITDYADKLVEGLNETAFIEKVKQAQINWIGKSEGAKVNFKIKDRDESLEVFTTRPDTLYGATFMVIAPEHKLALEMAQTDEKVKEYLAETRKKSDLERLEVTKEKTGVFSGLYAINPITNKEIPIWISDFVLASYGTGAIMSVPAHDERDYDFAIKFGLNKVQVLAPIFRTTTGKDAVREDKETVNRKTVYAFVKHWSEDKYLCLDWKDFGWHSGIIGGINEGEDWVEAAKREIVEETGYTNLVLEKELGVEIHNHFFAAHKDENRYAAGKGFVFKLQNDQKQETKEEDTKHHDLVWIDAKEMDNFLNLDNQKFLWQLYQSGKSCFTGDGILINSENLNGLNKEEAINKMSEWIKEKGIGEKTASYHLRDWIFSRQHYWGEPIPMIYCKEHGWQTVPEDQLPIKLPDVEQYEPTDDGQSPLSQMTDWVKTTCPKCGGPATRETDTMPNWAGSDWYFLRYMDPHNDAVIASQELMKYWGPVDVYIGGDEHNVLHLLYSRFIYKFLWDLGAVPKEIPEPYFKRLSHGVILGPDNQRMSKSKGNVIVPEVVADKYGVDVVRMYLMFMGPFDATMAWNENTLMGVKRFLDRLTKFYEESKKNIDQSNEDNFPIFRVKLNKAIKKMTEDYDQFKYNTAIAQMMELLNDISEMKGLIVSKESLNKIIKLLAPIAPYMSEEWWSWFNEDGKSVYSQEWPKFDENFLTESTIKIAVAINGKVRDEIEIETAIKNDKEAVEAIALNSDRIKIWLVDKEIKKQIYVPGRMVNLVVG